MIRRCVYSLVFVLFLGSLAVAQGHGFGLGLEAGTPSGLSAKAWLTHSTALQFGFGLSTLSHSDGTVFSLDYLWHVLPFHSREVIPLYCGIGGVVGGGTWDRNFGVRGVGGIAWMPHGTSIDIFLQAMPTLYLQNNSHFDVDGALGFRYYF